MNKEYCSPLVKRAQYAVRGLIPIRANEIKSDIAAGKGNYPFKTLVYCNIGNPQSLQQKPLTFFREVMALMDAPHLLQNNTIVSQLPSDVVERATKYLSTINYVTGAYTESSGYQFACESVAAYINARDENVTPLSRAEDIFLSDGASSAVKLVMQLLIGGPQDAMMLPIPQYPLYTAQLALLGGTAGPYYLCEKEGWSTKVDGLATAYDHCVSNCKATPRLFVVINPGNPTGNVLEKNVMESIVKFCHDHQLVLLADEVYQENIYVANKHFVSFRSVVRSMPAPYNT